MIERNMTTIIHVAHLSNEELLAEVTSLAARERGATAALVASLAELDDRRLYLGEGYSSLFTYCTPENLQLRCRAHNAYESEQCFGSMWVRERGDGDAWAFQLGPARTELSKVVRVRNPPKADPRRRGSVNAYGRRAAFRSVVGSRRTVLAYSSTTARVDGRAFRIARTCPGLSSSFAVGIPWQMLPQELQCGSGMTLAAPARLATGWRLGSDSLCAAGLARSLRPD
jgi:hypothetical protein